MSSEAATVISKELLNIIKFLPEPYMIISSDLRILAASDSYLQVTQRSRDELIGTYLFDSFPDNPASPQANAVNNLRNSIVQAIAQKTPQYMPRQHYDIPRPAHLGGGFEQRYWRASNTPILDEAGEVLYILHKTEDITEHIHDKRQIQQLTDRTEELLLQEQAAHRHAKRQREYLYELIMQTPVAIAILQGSNYTIELANGQMLNFWGRSLEAVVNKPLFDAIPEAKGQGYEQLLTQVRISGQPVVASDVSVMLKREHTIEQVYFHFVFQPFRDIQGEVTGVIISVIDISDQVAVKKQLERTMQDLKERNYELDQFVYKTSHDLRAPLMSILGLVNLIKQEPLPPVIGQYIHLIDNRVHKLDSFIKSMLDYSRSTRSTVQYTSVDMDVLIKEILTSLELMKNFERLHISTIIQSGEFYSDVFRLKTILSNLISNAVKYQDLNKHKSCLTIKVKVNPERVIIHLQDNGVGIADSYQDRIFGMFFRATDQSEGSGLGLYIVKQAVSVLKGSLQFRSKLGKGTDFVINLPNHTQQGAS